MPALIVLLSLASDAALWVPMCLERTGITIDRTKATAEIDLRMFNELIGRVGRLLAPTKRRLGLSEQQEIEVNAQLRELRHHLIVDVQR
jgi:hypothetical protein